MDELQHTGQRLAALRKEAGLSREQLAVKAGISGSTVVRTELGKHDPSLATVAALAAALGVPVSRLLGESEAVK